MFQKNCNLTEAQIQEKAQQLLGKMKLKDKVMFLSGNWQMIRDAVVYKRTYNPVPIESHGCKRLGIKPVAFTDGPRGVVMGNSTCFPVSMARAASFDRELERAQRKEEAGIMAFLTQPILSQRAIENVQKARAALKGYLFGGLFPIVSYKNACFLQNEVAGVTVDPDILEAYRGLDRAQGEALARKICREAAQAVRQSVDGFYIMTPFQRVNLVSALMAELRGLHSQ